jgi:biopolymer transport protein TolR
MAGGASDDADDATIDGINITPLVDIVLVLLVIFMATARYLDKESIPVDLPRVANGAETSSGILTIALTKEGRLYLDGAPSSESELRSRARAAASSADARAIISADKAAQHGDVVHLIDLVKGEGIARFAINIEREP